MQMAATYCIIGCARSQLMCSSQLRCHLHVLYSAAEGHALLQEIRILRSVSFDRNIVQFCGACLQPTDTMMILEYMAVSFLVL